MATEHELRLRERLQRLRSLSRLRLNVVMSFSTVARASRDTSVTGPGPSHAPGHVMNRSDPVDERRSMEAVKADESALVAALRAGDERAFMQLVEAYTPGMRRLALTFVRTPAIADDVVGDSRAA